MRKRIQVELMDANLAELRDLTEATDPSLSLTFLANQAIKRGLPLLKESIESLADTDGTILKRAAK